MDKRTLLNKTVEDNRAQFISESLLKSVREFNLAMLEWIADWEKDHAGLDHSIFKLDLDERRIEKVCDLEKEKSDASEKSGSIRYYWIELSEGQNDRRITLFLKEVDVKTGNIHVIPGIIEQWVKEQDSASDISYLDDASSGLAMKNALTAQGCYLYRENGWTPEPVFSDQKDRWYSGKKWDDKEPERIQGFREYVDGYKSAVSDPEKGVVSELEKSGLFKSVKRSGGIAPRLDILRWLNIDRNEDTTYFFNFEEILYIEGQGLFVKYPGLWAEEGKKPENGGESNRPNDTDHYVDENGKRKKMIRLNYRRISLSDAAEARLIKRGKFHVWDCTNGTFPEKPEVKYVRDFDEFIDKIELASDTIFDLLWLYNISGLLVEKVVKYRDPDERVGIRVAYTIFGTYVKENDTDRYFPEAETGAYNLGNASDWSDNEDLFVWFEEERPLDQLRSDIRKYYDASGINLE